MNLSPITFELLSERYEEIPERFRELLESPGTKTTLARIGAQHALDHERQTLLEALVGLVFVGFLSPDDLAGEFVDRLFLNFVHARALAREVDEVFFAPHRRDLTLVYNPVGGTPQGPTVRVAGSMYSPQAERPSIGKTISLESIGTAGLPAGQAGGGEQKIPIMNRPGPSAPFRRNVDEAAPLVILGSASPTSRKPIIPNRPTEHLPKTASEKPVYHSPFSFRFPFRSPQEGGPTAPTATVRLPDSTAPEQKKDELHVVHYAETRGKLGPPLSTGKEGVVNLDQLSAKPTTDNRQPIVHPEQMRGTTDLKPQPKIEGNTIDLRRQ